MKRNISIILLIFAIFGIILTLYKLKLPDDTYLWREIHNTGHTPLFGILSLLILGLSLLILGNRILKRHLHYLIALIVTVLIGIITELIQIYGSGDADVSDLVRDIIGVISFLGFFMVYDRKMIVFWRKCSKKRILTLIGAFLLLVLSLIPVSLWAWVYHQRNQAFPQILGFESHWERKFIRTQHSKLTATYPPPGWQNPVSHHVGQLTLSTDTYPGFSIEEPFPNWTGYELLSFTVYSELDTTVNLTIRIEDFHHNSLYEDRFNYAVSIDPGMNRILIPLEKVREAPASREMDMAAIRAICLFTVRPGEDFTLYIDDLQLK